MVLANETWADREVSSQVARLMDLDIAAVEPGLFGFGPIPAVKRVLARTRWNNGDVKRIETSEAFAVITPAVM